MIQVTWDDRRVQKALADMAGRCDDLRPALSDIGELLAESAKRRFATATAPDGRRWAPNKPSTMRRYLTRFSGSQRKRGGGLTKRGAARAAAKKPLTGETKALRTTIAYTAEARKVTIHSPMEYAAVQQFGAKKGAFGRTRKGAPIPWGDIPARPFLGISDDDRDGVLRIVRRYVVR